MLFTVPSTSLLYRKGLAEAGHTAGTKLIHVELIHLYDINPSKMLPHNPVYHFDKLYSKSVQHSLGKNVKEMLNQSIKVPPPNPLSSEYFL